MRDTRSSRIKLTEEFYVSSWSKAIGRNLESLMKEYKVQFLQPVLEPNKPFDPNTQVQAGMYLRVTGEWDQVGKFIKYADMPQK